MRKEKLGDICDIVIGRTPSRSVAEYWGTGYPWVSISDLKEKYIKHTKEEITYPIQHPMGFEKLGFGLEGT